jgi:hypothetical protein
MSDNMDKVIEKFSSTHDLRVDGHHLIEKRQKTLSYEMPRVHWTRGTHQNEIEKTVVVHVRTINDKSYKVTKSRDELDTGWILTAYPDAAIVFPADKIQVETKMTEDEVKQFEEDWKSLWNPETIKNEIENLHRQGCHHFPRQ